MQRYPTSVGSLAKAVWDNRELITTLTKREIVGRYRGSALGLLWSFLNPLFMLGVYTFVFSVVFKARWQGGDESRTEFAIILFAGLMLFNLFAEVVNRSPSLILANANFVKKVVFPLEILPVVTVGTAVFHLVVSFVVWLAFFIVVRGAPPMTALLAPIAILPLLLFSTGLSWFLASLGVYLRDVGQISALATTALMFLSPIFFPVSALPPTLQRLMLLNPLTSVIETAREWLVWGRPGDVPAWGMMLGLSVVVAWAGYIWFQRTRAGFADVL